MLVKLWFEMASGAGIHKITTTENLQGSMIVWYLL